MKTQRFISFFVGGFFLAAALASGFWPSTENPVSSTPSKPVVRVEPVKRAVVHRQVRLSGITRAARRAVLAFSLPARMERRWVKVGDHVLAGTRIARLEIRQFDNAVASARAHRAQLQAQLDQALRDRDRFATLNREQVVSVGEFERMASTVQQLTAALQAAEVDLREALRARDEADLRAPFDGTITAVHLEAGEWATPGLPVVELSGKGPVELEIDVPETIIEGLSEGQRVDVYLPFANHKRVDGRLVALARAARESGRLFPMQLWLDESDGVLPGMTAEVLLTISMHPQLLVPVNAVVNPGATQPSVFVVSGEIIREVTVSVGQLEGGAVVVNGELTDGDLIVVAGHTALTDGQQVVVQP